MSKHAHVVKTAGQLINDDFLEKLCKNHRHYFGVSVAKDDRLFVVREQIAPEVAKLKEMQEAFKDHVALLVFGDANNILEEDMQPYTILQDGDGNDVCVVALDGDFDRHKKSNETHIPEWTVVQTNLSKRIKKYVSGGMGIDQIIAELNDELTKQDICNLWGERGCVTFMFGDGQVCTIKNEEDTKGVYSWGFASSTYGVMENVGDKPASTLDTLKGFFQGTKVAPTPVAQNGAAVSKASTAPPTDTTVKELHKDAVLVKPDFQFYDTRKKQKAWYEDKLGYEPQQYKSAPMLLKTPTADGHAWTMADTKTLGLLAHTVQWDPAKGAGTKSIVSDGTGPQPEVKQEVVQKQEQPTSDLPVWMQSKSKTPSPVKDVGGQQSKTIAQSALPAGGNDQAKTSVPASMSTAKLPILPPDQVQKVQEIMKKNELVGFFGENMKKIIDPKELKKQIENDIPDFAKRFGIGEDMSAFDRWEYEQFYQWAVSLLTIGKPDVIAKMMFDLRNHGLNIKYANLTNPNFRQNIGSNKAAM